MVVAAPDVARAGIAKCWEILKARRVGDDAFEKAKVMTDDDAAGIARELERMRSAMTEAGFPPRECSGCGRIMSVREWTEQRLCDDCAGRR